jgi:outer membrane protein
MKNSLALAAAFAAGLSLSAIAQTLPTAAQEHAKEAPAGPAKIGVIAFQVAVAQTNEGQRNYAEITKKFEPQRQRLKAMSDELDQLAKQLQTQGDTLSEAERANRTRVLDEKKKAFDRDADDAKNNFQGEMQDMVSSLSSKVYDVMETYAQKEGYTLVLDESQQGGPVLVAVSQADITRAVIDAYNLKSGVPAMPAPAKATAPRTVPQSAKPAPAQ